MKRRPARPTGALQRRRAHASAAGGRRADTDRSGAADALARSTDCLHTTRTVRGRDDPLVRHRIRCRRRRAAVPRQRRCLDDVDARHASTASRSRRAPRQLEHVRSQYPHLILAAFQSADAAEVFVDALIAATTSVLTAAYAAD